MLLKKQHQLYLLQVMQMVQKQNYQNIETSTDAISDDAEYFYVDLFKSIADANAGWPYETFDTAYIANGQADASASRTYTIDNNSKTTSGAKDEGSSVTFTISVDDTSAASKVWVSTVDGTAKAGEDYTALTKKKVKFAQGESSKTVTVDLLNDTDTSDDNEVFYLELINLRKMPKVEVKLNIQRFTLIILL